jgi:hypothetical protein
VAVTGLAEDRRGRVPFALIGVLLLVGASTYSASVATDGPNRFDRRADVAMERVSVGTTAALRSAVGEAARAAAAEPVTTRATTEYGRVLDEANPFRDALSLRIYLRLRAELPATRYRRGDVTAVGTVPAARTPDELADALDRITVAGVDNGTSLRVTVRKLTVTVRKGDRILTRENRTRTVTVSTPVLALHERASAFETRLNRGPLDGPGLGRRLTARLYPITWARGYAQYGDLPITNVLATRHVETATNGAVLESQRAVFGRSDPAGRAAMRRASAELGLRDIAAATAVDRAWADRVLPRPNARSNHSGRLPTRRGTSAPSPARRLEVDVGPVAGRALTGLRIESVRANRTLRGVTRAAYRVQSQLRTTRRRTYSEPRPEPEPPGTGWELANATVSVGHDVESSVGPTPRVAPDERQFDSFGRRVTVDRRVRWLWRRGNDTVSTSEEWTERYRVGVTLVGAYAPDGAAPDRPTVPRFERGGPLEGPNLADVSTKAATALVDSQGGEDGVAVAVARGDLDEREAVVYGDRPRGLRSWVGASLSDLRRRLANRSVEVRAGEVATFTTNPAERLAADLRDRRAALVAAPGRYRGVADRARVSARAALVDATIRRLERRAATHDETKRAFDAVLGRIGVESSQSLALIRQTRRTSIGSRRERIDGNPPGGPVSVVPDGSPAYLTVASVTHGRARGVAPSRSYHPLTTRNVNLFTAPYGDAADAVTTQSYDRASQVRLRTAARTLLAAEATSNVSEGSRRRLRRAVSASVDELRLGAGRVVANETALSRPAATDAVDAGLSQWQGDERQALAATNGSLSTAVAVAANERTATPRPRRVERLETHLDATVDRSLRSPAGTVSEAPVADLMGRVRDRALNRAGAAATDRVARSRLNGTLGGVPAGLPVAPVPGYWYATVNVWTVDVRGAYARFTLRTHRDTTGPSTATRYVRDGSVVRLDVDGDGGEERIGRDERVAFESRTAVAVAVPPYRSGVGDVDGNADERAGTWPRPGCSSWGPLACRGSE